MRTKAISPVIATVIIVSVAIAIAVAVAFWMTGITGLFTRYEKLEVINAYATSNGAGNWTVTLLIKNSGTSDATIDEIFINGKPLKAYASDAAVLQGATAGTSSVTIYLGNYTLPSDGIGIRTGEEYTINIIIDNNNPNLNTDFSSGQIVEVKIHTAAGNEYPKSVQLP